MSTKRGGGVHTVSNPGGRGWVNDVRGIKVVGVAFQLKKDATAAGRDLAIRLETEHTIHLRNGRIGKKNSYGNDPYPPADAK